MRYGYAIGCTVVGLLIEFLDELRWELVDVVMVVERRAGRFGIKLIHWWSQ